MAKGRRVREDEDLISIEGEKDFLTPYEANGFPANDIVSSDQIDDVLMMFDEMDIDVVDDLQALGDEEEKVLEKEDEEEVDEFDIETFGKALDPVRMYLREMGSVSLLSREGEVEIAKRIEFGKREVLDLVLTCPMAVKEVIHLGKAVNAGKAEIREITNEIDEEETNLEEERVQKERLLQRIDRIRRCEEGIRRLHRKKELPKARVQARIQRKRDEILQHLRELNLRDLQISRIIQKMKQGLNRLEKAENEFRRIEERWGGLLRRCGVA